MHLIKVTPIQDQPPGSVQGLIAFGDEAVTIEVINVGTTSLYVQDSAGNHEIQLIEGEAAYFRSKNGVRVVTKNQTGSTASAVFRLV